jgi:hypothetical protein
MAMRGGSGVSLPAKALRSATATSTPLVRTIMMSSKMQSNLTEVATSTEPYSRLRRSIVPPTPPTPPYTTYPVSAFPQPRIASEMSHKNQQHHVRLPSGRCHGSHRYNHHAPSRASNGEAARRHGCVRRCTADAAVLSPSQSRTSTATTGSVPVSEESLHDLWHHM